MVKGDSFIGDRGDSSLLMGDRIRLFPIVLCGNGAPWAEANLWLLDMLETRVRPNMHTFSSIADDLAAYRRYIEDEDIDWLDFGVHRLRRPTYRYSAALRISLQAGATSAAVAKRRVATVIRFYRWMMRAAMYIPAHPPWIESDRYVDWKDDRGFSRCVTVKTTDVAMKVPSVSDPLDDRILDGGRLRPLPRKEQQVLLLALSGFGNTEMSLVHLFSLLSGARIQTVLTVRVRHVTPSPSSITGPDFRLKAGPGTGIDTKGDKPGVLSLPKWFYERLHVYVKSERARTRRLRANGGDHDDQFLFLSQRGNAMYEPRDHTISGANPPVARHAKTGQAVRQFIKECLLPEMRCRLGDSHYEFSFHDLRATFGMNMVDHLVNGIGTGALTYTMALDRLRQMMWHSSLSTTEKYLNYRQSRATVEAAGDGWHSHLAGLAKCAADSMETESARN